MADLLFPDVVGQYQQGLAFGRQMRAQDQAEQQRSRLGQLAQQAYGATGPERQSLIGESVGIDPDAGFALGKQLSAQDDQRTQQLVSSARLLVSAPEAMRPALWGRIRSSIAQSGIIPEANLPQQYDQTVADTAQALVQAYSGGQSGAVQSRFVGEDGQVYALMRDGSVHPLGIKADPRVQIIEGEGGFYRADLRGGTASPVQVGQAPPRLSAGTPTIDGQPIPADELPYFQQLADATARGEEVTIPVPQGGQLRSKPKERDQWAPLRPDEVRAVGLPEGTVAQRNTATGQVQTIRLPAASATSGGKPLPQGTVDKLTKDAGRLTNLQELAGSFKDDYAGTTFGGSLENIAGRLGGERFGLATPGQAEWWQQYDRLKNEVRNELFGASLTEGEKAAFEAADINPNTSATVLRQNLATQARIIQQALQRKAKTWAAQGYNRDAIEAATGISTSPGGASGEVERYQVGQIIEVNGKRYRVTGGDPNDPDVEEVR